jgi:predicted AAA+ superfamily ATPase
MKKKHRAIYKALLDHLPKKEFAIITGARQTGKTTLIEQIKETLDENNQENYLLSAEDSSVLKALNKHPENIFQFIPLPENNRIILFIDEVQYLENPSNFLKLLFDKYNGKLKIYATGSSAFYIDKKFKDSLAGRKRLFRLNTLDFDEFLYFKTGNNKIINELKMIRTDSNYISFERKNIERYLDEYLTFGGYPAVVIADSNYDKKLILKEIWQSYLKRDILDSNVKNEDNFYSLLKILAYQSANLLNKYELANTLQISVSSVDNYLYILRKSFHISLIKPFYKNIRKEMTKMPKLYFNDLGFRNIVLNNFDPVRDRFDKGEIIENYVFLRLAQLYDMEDIKFWRTATGGEVDFVVSPSFNSGFAIETKFNAVSFKKAKYKKFIEAYPEFPLSVLAYESTNNSDNILRL